MFSFSCAIRRTFLSGPNQGESESSELAIYWANKSAGISTTSRCGWWHHAADPFWSAQSGRQCWRCFPASDVWLLVESLVAPQFQLQHVRFLIPAVIMSLWGRGQLMQAGGAGKTGRWRAGWAGSAGGEWVVSEGRAGGLLIKWCVYRRTF